MGINFLTDTACLWVYWPDQAVLEETRDMSGIDPSAYLEKLALHLDQLQEREEIEVVLRQLESLFGEMPAELEETATKMMAVLHGRLGTGHE